MTGGPTTGSRCAVHYLFDRIGAAAAFVVPDGLTEREALAEIRTDCDQIEALLSSLPPSLPIDSITAALAMAHRRDDERRHLEELTKLPPVWRRSTIRRLADLTCAEVGAAIGVAGSTVAGWERGRTPAPENAIAYAEILRRIEEEFAP